MRRYNLFRPAGVKFGERLPLMVMLHGCGRLCCKHARELAGSALPLSRQHPRQSTQVRDAAHATNVPTVMAHPDHQVPSPMVGPSSQSPMVIWLRRRSCDDTDGVTSLVTRL
jgi:hypothetical protein